MFGIRRLILEAMRIEAEDMKVLEELILEAESGDCKFSSVGKSGRTYFMVRTDIGWQITTIPSRRTRLLHFLGV